MPAPITTTFLAVAFVFAAVDVTAGAVALAAIAAAFESVMFFVRASDGLG